MKDFFLKMMSESADVSHKRVIVSLFAICIVIFCFIATYTSKVIPEFMFDALCWIVAGGMGLTILDKFAQKKVEAPQEEN
jgi:lipoprotein signal peptidase